MFVLSKVRMQNCTDNVTTKEITLKKAQKQTANCQQGWSLGDFFPFLYLFPRYSEKKHV